MLSAICDDRSMCEAVLKKEVVVMEDSPAAEEAIKEVMEEELGWTVKMAKDSNEVAEYAKNKEAAIFILDNKIGNNPTEGLEALEKITRQDNQILVSMFSGFDRKKREKQARKIHPNLVVFEDKTSKLKNNVCHIATETLERKKKILDSIKQDVIDSDTECHPILLALIEKEQKEVEQDLEKIKKLEEIYSKEADLKDEKRELDRNFEAYEEKRRLDKKWLAKYEGKYVAFVDGEQVFPEITDEQKLLKLIRDKYPYPKLKLFTKIEEEQKYLHLPTDDVDTMIDLPSSLDIFYKFE